MNDATHIDKSVSWQSLVGTLRPLSMLRRQQICQSLELLYDGEADNIESAAIAGMIKNDTERERLQNVSLPINVLKRPVDSLATAYAQRGIKRVWVNATDTQAELLDKIYYDELDINTVMLNIHRNVILTGTAFMLPCIDPADGTFYFIELTPSEASLNVKTVAHRPSILSELSYTIKGQSKSDLDIKYRWTLDSYKETNNKTDTVINSEPLTGWSANKNVWVPIRYGASSRSFWGPTQVALYRFSMCIHTLLADAMLRSQTSLYNILVTLGVPEAQVASALEALVAAKVIPLPAGCDAKFISPNMLEPEALSNLIDFIATFMLRNLGIAPRNLETSNDPQSAEALKTSDQLLQRKSEEDKIFFSKIEKDIFQRIVWRINNYSNYPAISDNVYLRMEWPEQKTYSSISDRVAEWTFKLDRKLATRADYLVEENVDLTKDEAMQKLADIDATDKPADTVSDDTTAVE